MRPLAALFASTLVMGLISCGSQQGPQMPAAPDPDTRATLAGPLCGEQVCKCSEDPSAIGEVPEGFKRFKIELGPNEGQLWGSVNENIYYKGFERATECFYVDLEPGEHPISLRAKGKAGFGARMAVSELGGPGPSFYSSFEFACGAPGLCDQQGLRDWKKQIGRFDAGKHAPCGSVRILGIDWKTGRMPDNLHPADFHLSATMKIYKFAPQHPPGSSDCGKGGE